MNNLQKSLPERSGRTSWQRKSRTLGILQGKKVRSAARVVNSDRRGSCKHVCKELVEARRLISGGEGKKKKITPTRQNNFTFLHLLNHPFNLHLPVNNLSVNNRCLCFSASKRKRNVDRCSEHGDKSRTILSFPTRSVFTVIKL